MTQALAGHDQLARELEHFERVYTDQATHADLRLSAEDKRRYANPPANTIYPREYFYHLLAPLRGKRVLEIACGGGIDTTICAYNGAKMFAYDLSPAATNLTRQRAEANGVSDRVQLEVTGDFNEAFAGETFDAVIGYAALHHLPLEGLAEAVHDRLRRGGVAVFAEPVVNSRMLDFVRRSIPFQMSQITEDEQPLNDRVIDDFAQPFEWINRREFQCVSRLWPLVRKHHHVVRWLHKLDACLMHIPLLRPFASVVVFAVAKDD